MITFERVKELANKQGKSLNKVEDDLGFARNSLYALKRNKPSVDRITKLADYFHVTEAYLLGRVDNPEFLDWDSTIATEKEPKESIDLKKVISEKKPTSWDDPRIDWDEWVSFDGKPISDDVKKMLFAIYADKLTD